MPTTAKTERSWFLALFGLPFFCVGAGFLAFSIIPNLHDAWQMASWTETRGTLLKARLNSYPSEDSTTYSVTAEYLYNAGGRSYRGNRIAIGSSSDNVGDFQQELGNRLEQALRNEQPVSIWYDPENPERAVLNRDLRWGLLGLKAVFVTLFGGFGLVMLYAGLRGVKSVSSPEAEAKPWLKRVEWRGGIIRSGAKTGMYFAWGFALFWNLISLTLAFFFNGMWQDVGAIALLVLLFPLAGLLLLVWAVKTTLEWRRFGATPMTMDPFPGAIGGDVGGEIVVNLPYQPSMIVEVTLSCINSYVSGSGDDRSRSEKLIWQDKGYAEIHPATRGSHLQFRFEVPDNLPASETYGSNYHLWRLAIHGDLPGVDLNRSFEIPVYPSAEKSRHIPTLSTRYHPAGVAAIDAESLLPLTRVGSRVDIHYPMLRKPLSAFAILLFGGIFNGSGVFLWRQAALEGFPLYLMSGIFSFVGGLIVLASFYSLFNSLQVRFDGRSLTAVRRILGIPASRKTVAYPLIRSFEVKQNGSSQTGNTHTANYQVIANTASGKLVLAEKLDSHSSAEKVVAYFEKLTNGGK